MPNLVDNSKLLTSTNGDLQVMDSLGNFPTVYPGVAGVAPDNYWFLGGPDYGTFLAAGGLGGPDGKRRILNNLVEILG